MQRFIIILLLLFIGQLVMDGQGKAASAQAEQPAGGMLPPNYKCTMTVYDSTDNKPYEVPAQVRAYVIWTDRPLSLEYYVSNEFNGQRYYSVLSRESLEKVCK